MPENGKNRVTQAYERLRSLIVHGNLAPGSRLIETDLVDRLGVSRTPVRAALQRLEQEGYIQTATSGQRWRPSVAPLTKKDADELFYLIGQLEGLAAWYTTQLEGEEHEALVKRLRQINGALQAAAEQATRDPARYYDLDYDFHRTYAEAAAGHRLAALLRATKPQAERYIRVYVSALTNEIETSIREHDAIIDAIEARDAAAAQHAVEANWRGAVVRFAGVIERLGEQGSW